MLRRIYGYKNVHTRPNAGDIVVMSLIKMQITVETENTKFQCSQCGKCCSRIRGNISSSDLEFLEEHAYGNLPIVQLNPIRKTSFPLWDWEAKRFMQWQKEAGIDARIMPSKAILDLNSNKAIIVSYHMDYDSCPFLKDNKCSIYYTKRAYVCRMFPFNRGPFLNIGENKNNIKKENLFGECGGMKNVMPNIPDDFKEMIKFLSKTFPDGSFVNAVQNDTIIEWMNKIIIQLIRSEKIRPAINYPYRFLTKRIDNSEKIDFTVFLMDIGFIGKDEMENIIKRFDENSDAMENIKGFFW